MDANNFFTNLLNNTEYSKLGSGFLLGLSVGYFFKKSFKIMLFVLGLAVVALFWFDNNNTIEIVNNGTILGTFDKISHFVSAFGHFLYDKLSNMEASGGAGAIAGFLLGLKLG